MNAVFAERPWAYSMIPQKHTKVRTRFDDMPEQIRRCENCKYPDCMFRTIEECISADTSKSKQRKIAQDWRYGYWRQVHL